MGSSARAAAALALALWGPACSDQATTLLVAIDGPASLTSIDVTVGLDGNSVSRDIPLGTGKMTLPGSLIVELPDRPLSVTLDVVGHGDGPLLTAHAVVTSHPHEQLAVTLSLGAGDMGVTDDLGAADLGAVADLNAHDMVTPPDLGRAPPVPRLISTSYFSDGTSTFSFPSGMSHSGFAISTSGVVDGDLLIILANVDNGGSMVWPDPIATGFHQLAQAYFGSDGQTYLATWKIASGEPSMYTGAYGPGGGSSAAVISLIAVSGANPTAPINAFLASNGMSPGTNPVLATSPGVTTTVSHCTLIYGAGSDWLSSPGSNTFTLPSGYSSLMQLGDHGSAAWDWSSQMVGWSTQSSAGATGSLSGTLNASTINGIPWAVVIAIAP